jgi:hypothetical protein
MPDFLAFSFSSIALFIVMGIGLILLISRPYWAFLFATLVSISFSYYTMTFSRFEEVGPYFNMYSACLLISFFAMLVDIFKERKSIYIPKLVIGISAIILMGVLNSWISYGLTYNILQGFRWVITLPVLFFISANMVWSERRVKLILLTLAAGSLFAEAQHLFLMSLFSVKGFAAEDPTALRITQFELACAQIWLLAGPFLVNKTMPKKYLQFLFVGVIMAGLITVQSRSVALAFFLCLVVYHLWFLQGRDSYHLKRLSPLLLSSLIALMLLGTVKLTAMAGFYVGRMGHTLSSEKGIEQDPRAYAFSYEINDWLNGNILIGRGLSYYTDLHHRKMGASGHLGYIAYLSQTGILGFIVLGIWFPFSIIFLSRRVFKLPHLPPAISYLAAVTAVCFIYNSFWFLFTNSYLAIHIVAGILAGAIWRISLESKSEIR